MFVIFIQFNSPFKVNEEHKSKCVNRCDVHYFVNIFIFLFQQPVTHVFARNIAKHVLKTQSMPLLLSIALEDYTPEVMKGIEKVIQDYVI